VKHDGKFVFTALRGPTGLVDPRMPGGDGSATASTWSLVISRADWGRLETHATRCSVVMREALERGEQAERFPADVSDPALDVRRAKLKGEHGRGKPTSPALSADDDVVDAWQRRVQVIARRLQAYKNGDGFREDICPACARRVRRWSAKASCPPAGTVAGAAYVADDELRWDDEDESLLVAGALEHPVPCPAIGLNLSPYLRNGRVESPLARGVSTRKSRLQDIQRPAPAARARRAANPPPTVPDHIVDAMLAKAVVCGPRARWSTVAQSAGVPVADAAAFAMVFKRFNEQRRTAKSRNEPSFPVLDEFCPPFSTDGAVRSRRSAWLAALKHREAAS